MQKGFNTPTRGKYEKKTIKIGMMEKDGQKKKTTKKHDEDLCVRIRA